MPSNHDDKSNLFQAFNTELQSAFQLGDWQNITLDSVRINKVNDLLNEDWLRFLDDTISNSTAKYIFVYLHHSIIPMNSDWDGELSLENPKDFFAVVERHSNVKAIAWGHAYHSEIFNYKGVSIFSSPYTALQLNGPDNIGYNDYTLHSDGNIEYKTHWLWCATNI